MHSDLLIFEFDGSWFWASIDPQETRAPFTVIGKHLVRRLWRDEGLSEELWTEAKLAWMDALGGLRERRVVSEAEPKAAA